MIAVGESLFKRHNQILKIINQVLKALGRNDFDVQHIGNLPKTVNIDKEAFVTAVEWWLMGTRRAAKNKLNIKTSRNPTQNPF